MQLVDLDTAVSEILQACADDESAGGKRHPFFFVVGAGISAPVVPLAARIQEDCRAVAGKYDRAGEASSPKSIDLYSYWFQNAYPQPVQRQRFLRKLIDGKPISHSNFRLAHLLSAGTLANLVITPNFDDFLSRALTLFGQPHIVCDHPRTVERIDPEGTDHQIVHVHGTYWFYDCCNLRGEIEGRAQASAETTLTMAWLLDNVLSRHSPLVLGYSGWEGDVIMAALKRRLLSRLPYKAYWFCYRREETQGLPDWLSRHPDVAFVVPTKGESEGAADRKDGEVVIGPLELSLEMHARSERPVNVLSAQSVLDRLIRGFGLPAPELTTDPIKFFASQLRRSIPPRTDRKATDQDIYFLDNVVERLERSTSALVVDPLEQVRDAFRRSQYPEAIREAKALQSTPLIPAQLKELMEMVWSASIGLLNDAEHELLGYDLVIRFGDASEAAGVHDTAIRSRIAKALINKGLKLGAQNRSGDAIAVYDEVVRRFSDAPEPALREPLARALVIKGVRLGVLNRSEEEIAAYDEVVRRFGEAPEPALRERVAWALVNKGFRLGVLNRGEDEIAVYDEVVRRFGDSADPALREQVARALVNKGVRLGVLNRSEEEIAAYDEVVRRYGETTEHALQERVAWALFNKGFRLALLGRNEDAIATYGEVVRRFGESAEHALREPVARALVNKGVRLGVLNRSEEAVAVYDEVVRRFGEATEPALRELVAMALVNKGFRLGVLDRGEDEIAAYSEAVARFGDAVDPTIREQVGRALVNKGVRLGALSRNEDAVAAYDEVVRQFGDATEFALRELVAQSLVNKGVRLGVLLRCDEEIAAYDEVVTRFSDAAEPALREQVVKALVNKMRALNEGGRGEEALAVRENLLGQFGAAPAEPAIADLVQRAVLTHLGSAATPGAP